MCSNNIADMYHDTIRIGNNDLAATDAVAFWYGTIYNNAIHNETIDNEAIDYCGV